MEAIFAGLGLILIGGISQLIFPEKYKGWIFLIFLGIGICFVLPGSVSILFSGTAISSQISLLYPVGDVKLVIDSLSAFFILFISIMSFFTVLYSIGYTKYYINHKKSLSSFFFFTCVLLLSMLMVVIVQNALAFLMCWEIMSLSSFFLVTFENEKEETFKAGMNYLVAMHIGFIFLVCGFILLSIKSGEYSFDSFKKILIFNKEIINLVFILFFIGFGTKAGFIPLHTWLPRAHPAAPSPISGMMSGIMIKTGIYGILRLILMIGTPPVELSYFILIISTISALLGVIYAIAQHDLKKLLAFHSVENIGIIGMGIGVGMLGLSYNNQLMAAMGFGGGLLHIINHSIFKELLFFGAGSVYLKTHTRNIEDMGGLIKKMPYTGIFFLIGSTAISGLPPLNGFISEFMIYLGMFYGLKNSNSLLFTTLVLSIASLAFVGAMALLCFTKVFSTVFLGLSRIETVEKPVESSLSMLIPMFCLSLLCFIIGILPQFIINLAGKNIQNFTGINDTFLFDKGIFQLLTTISIFSLIFIVMINLILIIRYNLLMNSTVHEDKTWACGYQAGNARMQYTASSFAQPFLEMVKPVANIHMEIKKPEGIFPGDSSFESKSFDWFNHYIFKPIILWITKILDLFSWIQKGNTQQYILYGLIFLLLAIAWTMGISK